eukprot:g4596.t1
MVPARPRPVENIVEAFAEDFDAKFQAPSYQADLEHPLTRPVERQIVLNGSTDLCGHVLPLDGPLCDQNDFGNKTDQFDREDARKSGEDIAHAFAEDFDTKFRASSPSVVNEQSLAVPAGRVAVLMCKQHMLYNLYLKQGTMFNKRSSIVLLITNMALLLKNAQSFNADLSSWDVSRVTTMELMFDSASDFNADLSSWDVSRVTTMELMFDSASDFNADLSSWDVSRVTTMELMFDSASDFNADLSSWDVSRVTTMELMFDSASDFNADLSSWDVSRVTTMELMFDSASEFNADLSSWDVSRVSNMTGAFRRAKKFNQNIFSWDVSGVTTMELMFYASEFNADLSSWDVSRVSNMGYMMFAVGPYISIKN